MFPTKTKPRTCRGHGLGGGKEASGVLNNVREILLDRVRLAVPFEQGARLVSVENLDAGPVASARNRKAFS
jgi:hypothetical protein